MKIGKEYIEIIRKVFKVDQKDILNIKSLEKGMTNDSFVEHEIIRPFITDTYGENYKSEFTVDYDTKFSSFIQGKKTIKLEGKLGIYNNMRRNFKFQLAFDILRNNAAARQYLQSKYVMLFIDEYQDSDLDMHELFMYIKNELRINLFIVGDSKQAIYLWRGAQSNIFDLLEEENMNKYELIKNFRSNEEIVNYANLIHNNDYFDNSYKNEVQRVVHYKTNNFINDFSLVYMP